VDEDVRRYYGSIWRDLEEYDKYIYFKAIPFPSKANGYQGRMSAMEGIWKSKQKVRESGSLRTRNG